MIKITIRPVKNFNREDEQLDMKSYNEYLGEKKRLSSPDVCVVYILAAAAQ